MRAQTRPGSVDRKSPRRSLSFILTSFAVCFIVAFAAISPSAHAQQSRFGGGRPESGENIPPAQPRGQGMPIDVRAPTGAPPVVAFLDFESSTVDVDEEKAFSQALWSEFYRHSGARLLPRLETRQYLIRKNLYPGLPVGPEVSLQKVAEILNADYVVLGHINTTDGAYSMDYTVHSAKLGEQIAKDSEVAPGGMRELLLRVPDLARVLAYSVQRGEQLAAPGNAPGRVVELDQPEGAPTTADTARAEEAERRRARQRELEQLEREQEERTVRQPPRQVAQAPAAEDEAPLVIDRMAEESPAAPAAKPATAQTKQAVAEEPETAEIELEPTATPTPEPTPRPTATPTPTPTPRPTATPTPEPTPTPTPEPTETPTPTPSPTPEPTPEPTANPEPLAGTNGSPEPSPTPVVAESARESARELYLQSQSLPSDDYAQKIDLLRRAVTLDPTEGSYRKALALAYYNVGDYESSIEQSREAIALTPEDSILYTILGSAYFESHQYERAREAHEKAIEANPQNLYSRFNLALTLQAQGSPRALEAWETYLRLSEGDAEQASNRERAQEYFEDLNSQNG